MTGPTLSTSVNDMVYAYFCRTGTPVMTSGAFTPGASFTLGLAKYQDGCASEFMVSGGRKCNANHDDGQRLNLPCGCYGFQVTL